MLDWSLAHALHDGGRKENGGVREGEGVPGRRREGPRERERAGARGTFFHVQSARIERHTLPPVLTKHAAKTDYTLH